MSNLVNYAKSELKRIGMVDSGEVYNDSVAKAIMDLIELFAFQGHSGFSAPYVINAFSRLAMFKPLSPLTGEDDEWYDGVGTVQNKRYSAVFKDKDGVAYNIEGKVFTDDGEVWYTSKDSRVNVTFPYTVPDKPERVYRNKEDNEALEEESVIDKIRVEIEEYRSGIDRAISEDEFKIEGMKEAYTDCLEIIDKYMTNSEE